jgi:DNA-binding Lrp family transcriptional regulator
VRAYLDELGLPRHDVNLDLSRLRRLSIEALGRLSDEQLAERVGVPVSVAPVLRGARDLREARDYAEQVLSPQRVAVDAPETIERLRELVEGGVDPKGIVRELKAVGGNLKAVRLALTGRERGPELAAVIAALPRDELLARLG